MSNSTRGELIEVRVLREEEWALEAYRARLSFPEMRRRVLMHPEDGGLGYAISESGLRGLVASARARVGDVALTRDERAERMQLEIDERIRRARFDLGRAHAMAQEPRPVREEFADYSDYLGAVQLWAKTVEAAAKILDSADRRLAAAQKDERDLQGLNAPTRIEAEVTQRDGVLDDLNASLAALGRDPVEASS